MKKKIIPCAAMLTLVTVTNASFAAPILLFKNASNMQQVLSASAIPSSLNETINNLTTHADLYQIVVYQFNDHFILYLLSNKYWHIDKIRIDVDKSNNVTHVTRQYHENAAELTTLSQNTSLSPVTCPDNSVEFVAISAYPDLGDITKSINAVTAVAQQRYKTVQIISATTANDQTYENWLSCPNLKGFYSIGHGSESGLMVANGDLLNYTFFLDPKFNHKYAHTTVVINSCDVYDDPFGSELIFGGAPRKSDFDKAPGPTAYEYLGGYGELEISSSEDISACFLTKALQGAAMSYTTLKSCLGNYDLDYHNFSLSAPGQYFGI